MAYQARMLLASMQLSTTSSCYMNGTSSFSLYFTKYEYTPQGRLLTISGGSGGGCKKQNGLYMYQWEYSNLPCGRG